MDSQASKNSNIKADELFRVIGVIDLVESHFSGKTLDLEGDLSIDKAELNADFIEIISEKAQINSLSAQANLLKLEGSKEAEQVVFKDCNLQAQLLTCDNHITLDSSTFYGESKGKIAHDLCAHLKLKNSKFITKDGVRNYLYLMLMSFRFLGGNNLKIFSQKRA